MPRSEILPNPLWQQFVVSNSMLLNPLARSEGRKMRLPRVEARALIARLKVHGVAFDSARRAVVFIDSDAWHRTAEIGTVCRFASADSLRMGDGPVTEWISWPLRTEQAYRAAVLRNDALRVVLEWLRCELPWCLTWAPVLGSLHRWQQASTPNRLRRYEGAAHAERCSRPIVPHGELSTWAFIWLACLWLACLWRLVDGSTHQYWRNAKTWCAPQAYRRIAGHTKCAKKRGQLRGQGPVGRELEGCG